VAGRAAIRRVNLLFGVGSNLPTSSKQQHGPSELERRAEPLSALYLPAERWPASLLARPGEVIRNAARLELCVLDRRGL
jgi:hypothetical protein